MFCFLAMLSSYRFCSMLPVCFVLVSSKTAKYSAKSIFQCQRTGFLSICPEECCFHFLQQLSSLGAREGSRCLQGETGNDVLMLMGLFPPPAPGVAASGVAEGSVHWDSEVLWNSNVPKAPMLIKKRKKRSMQCFHPGSAFRS